MIIRTAEDTDAGALARLMTQLGYPTSSEEMGRRLEVILRSRDYHTVVAEVEDDVVGMAGATVGWYYERNGAYGRVVALVVAEEARGRGIGRHLVEQVESWLRQRGVGPVYINSGSHRMEAHEFYRRCGYEQTGLRFAKELAARR